MSMDRSSACLIALYLLSPVLFSWLGYYVTQLKWGLIGMWVAAIFFGIALAFVVAIILFVLSLLVGRPIA